MPEPTNNGPRVTCLGQAVILLFVLGMLGGAGYLLWLKYAPGKGGAAPTTPAGPASSGTQSGVARPGGPVVEIGIAYGTEKQRWLQWAVEAFGKTPDGARIKINLIPVGSLEGGQKVIEGDQRIHVWTPASSLYKDVFLQEWQTRRSTAKSPILKEEVLALTPMVFVLWAERADAFVAKFNAITFRTVGEALAEPAGWQAIAQKPEWGVFKFGHTQPQQSNSGLMTLVIMAYDFHQKDRGLVLKDVLDPAFQAWMGKFEGAISGMANSTGNMMRDMVLRGPSTYDGLFVYESVVIDYLKNAEGRWGELRVAYPSRNIWSDNPYYILDVDWSSADQRKAAQVFLDFLLTEPVQREALVHGFRPGNPAVPVKFPESPFEQFAKAGLRVDPPITAEPVKAEVINNLLQIWQRTRR